MNSIRHRFLIGDKKQYKNIPLTVKPLGDITVSFPNSVSIKKIDKVPDIKDTDIVLVNGIYYEWNENNRCYDALSAAPSSIYPIKYKILKQHTNFYEKGYDEWKYIGKNQTISVSKNTIISFREGFLPEMEKTINIGSIDITNSNYVLYGNIMSIINGDEFRTMTEMPENTKFYKLFWYNKTLLDASNLILPATTLAEYCYDSMFYGCSSLTSAPELPATTLADSCYRDMFYKCTSLTTAPTKLPATKLARYCYHYMFYKCTSLTTAPELPATTLADYCYVNMFDDCTSLTTAPQLPALILTSDCYSYMFRGCTSLTTAPKLPATTLAEYCYRSMFEGCTGLTTAPTKLPATTLARYCYCNMFYNCTSLTSAPELEATKLADGCYSFMFNGCTSLTTAPSKLLAFPIPIYYDTHQEMFSRCTSLTKSPIIYGVSNSQMRGMFNRCSSLNEITSFSIYYGEGTPFSWVNDVSPNGTFYTFKCTKDKWEQGDGGIPVNWDVRELTHFIIPDPLFKQEENADSTITYTSTMGWRKLQIFSQNPNLSFRIKASTPGTDGYDIYISQPNIDIYDSTTVNKPENTFKRISVDHLNSIDTTITFNEIINEPDNINYINIYISPHGSYEYNLQITIENPLLT